MDFSIHTLFNLVLLFFISNTPNTLGAVAEDLAGIQIGQVGDSEPLCIGFLTDCFDHLGRLQSRCNASSMDRDLLRYEKAIEADVCAFCRFSQDTQHW